MTRSVELVTTLEQAQELRALRNECRHWMTSDTAEISEEQQEHFFREYIAPGIVKAILLREAGKAVAYAVLRPSDEPDAVVMSCGVAEEARGTGIGQIAVHLITAMGLDLAGRVLLDVRDDNEPAKHVYEKAGYRVTGVMWTGQQPLITKMEYP